MKSIYSLIICLTLTANALAANLTAIPTPASLGKKNGKIILTITGGFAPYTILWSGPSGYTSSKLNPDSLAAGTYCVTVTDQYCGEASLCVTVTENTNSIDETIATKMSVYPNPFSNVLFIELPEAKAGKVLLSLYDQSGKQIANEQVIVQQKIQWNLKHQLSSGIYILQLTFEDGAQIRKRVTSQSK